MSIDAYKIAVQISLVENVTRGLAMLSRYFKAADTDAKALEARIARIGKMAAAGGILAAAGAGGFKLLQGPLEEAKKYETELAKFRAMGLGDAVTAQADKFAKGMNVIGQSATQNIKLLREATAVMGDFGHAQEMMPHLARMKSAVEMYSGAGHGEKAEHMMMDLLRVAELRGALKDPETFKRVTDLALKSYIASGGTVTPQQLLGAIKTGGVAAKGLSDEAFFFQELHLLQEMGGMRAGTSLMSAYQNLAQGRGSLRSAKVLQEMGLLDPNLIEYTKIGTIKQVKPGALKDSMTFMMSQFEYFEKEVKPQLEGLSKNDALLKIGSMFSNRTAAQRFSTFFLEEKNLQKTAKMAQLAMGNEAAVDNFGRTMAGKEVDLEAKLANLKLELGQKILPLAVRGLELLIKVLDRATQFAKDFPGLTKTIMLATAAISGLLVLGGGLMLLKAAISGLALLNIGGIATAIGGAGSTALVGALGAVLSPIGLVVAALATLAAAAYAFRPISQAEVDAAKHEGGARLTPGAQARVDAGETGAPSKYVQQGASQPVQVNTTIKLDSRVLAEATTMHQARELGRPQTGPNTFDPAASLRPSAL